MTTACTSTWRCGEAGTVHRGRDLVADGLKAHRRLAANGDLRNPLRDRLRVARSHANG